MTRPTIGRPRPHGPSGPTGPKPKPKRVTADTPFRQIPALTLEQWTSIFLTANSPILDVAQCWEGAGQYTALALDQAIRESSLGKTMKPGTENPLGLMGPDGRTLLRFDSTAAAFREFIRRLSDPTYKGGVYQPWDMPLGQYVRVYVAGPGPGYANGETAESVAAYLSALISDINSWLSSDPAGPSGPTGPSGPSGPSSKQPPKPAIELRLIDPNVNTAWDDLGKRQIRGIVLHRMLGTLLGTDEYFRGQARQRARTDFGIGVGRIFQWTPLESNITPWASGPANGIKGDAVAFYNRYGKGQPVGVSVCNRDCASIEIQGNYGDAMPQADWDNLVALVAWLASHYCGADASSWPKNRDGVHCLLWHNEWTNDKPCPGDWIMAHTGLLIRDVGERLAG
jgi:hypothetical protein